MGRGQEPGLEGETDDRTGKRRERARTRRRPHEVERDLTHFLGGRGVAAIGALLLSFVTGASTASAQTRVALPTAQNYDLGARSATAPATPLSLVEPIGTTAALPKVQAVLRATLNGEPLPSTTPFPTPAPAPRMGPIVVMHSGSGSLLSDNLAGSASAGSLAALVDSSMIEALDDEATCLATAVYFESKGEPLEGQLAVAQVVINRSRSGRFPPTLCGVVKQHAQFSFVRGGAFPRVNEGCTAWRRARAIARIAQANLVASLPTDVLWYHADYVTPRWRQALVEVEKIGAHIFYRA